MTKPHRPRDTNQLAKHIVDLATDQASDEPQARTPFSDAALRASAAGKVGGRARAQSLSSSRRSEIGKAAAAARWRNAAG